ncbi:MAG: hypothetical protein KGL43_21200 [Burkholderiales bacterium]|nr:hypothetical protein [Burkholderiales bacterium]MDE2396439.1 hypothetical protein [Burkholderiales bacterium]MDE2456111.1 hypothetical protein [Burkholderiales bacterium]
MTDKPDAGLAIERHRRICARVAVLWKVVNMNSVESRLRPPAGPRARRVGIGAQGIRGDQQPGRIASGPAALRALPR